MEARWTRLKHKNSHYEAKRIRLEQRELILLEKLRVLMMHRNLVQELDGITSKDGGAQKHPIWWIDISDCARTELKKRMDSITKAKDSQISSNSADRYTDELSASVLPLSADAKSCSSANMYTNDLTDDSQSCPANMYTDDLEAIPQNSADDYCDNLFD